MCGITGFIGMNNDNLLWKMTRIISHRGPDDEGIFSDRNVGLGHRRLSIIDLSECGHQPMADTENKAVIAYNGEIYNYNEIKKELIKLGFAFKSKTDTEVVLNAYLAWGEACLSHFNGMFAFAIWDTRDKTLFLARDHIGIKPLYYTAKNNIFLFGSEIKSILCSGKLRRRVNLRSLDYYFTFRYNHLDETLFEDVMKLPPGHYIKAWLENDKQLRVKIHKYWDISASTSLSGRLEAENSISCQLRTSVEQRMISDVPLGAFLSSGVDSSSITAIMARVMKNPVNTFTVGFGYPGFSDELRSVRFTTNHFKTEHTEYICKPDMVSVLPKVIWNADELNADPAMIPTFLISEIASRKVKVVLSGEGADEIFGGYERTAIARYAWSISQFCPPVMKMVPFLVNLLPFDLLDKMFKYSSSIGTEGIKRLSGFCGNIRNTGASYLEVASVFNHNEKLNLYGPRLRQRLKQENIADTLNKQFFGSKITHADELFDSLSLFELKTRLPNDLLAKLDTMTMAHSLEGRVPFLDRNLVQTAFSIPSSLKLRYFREKYILRKAVRQYLPAQVVKRRKDHFFVPIHLWLRNELKPLADRMLSRKEIEKTGYLDGDFVSHAYKNYEQGQLYYARQIWNILCFMIWHKLYIESDRFLSVNKVPITLEDLLGDS